MPIYTDGVWNMFSYFQNYGLKRGADIVNPEEVGQEIAYRCCARCGALIFLSRLLNLL